MKKILVAAILLIGCIGASAQTFGVGGGFINSSTKYDGGQSDPLNGGYVQATADLNLTSAFSVVAGLRYVYTGGSKDYWLWEGKVANHTLGVPVFAKMNVFNTGDLKAFIFAGPTLYYGLSSKGTNGGITINYYNNIFKPLNVTVGGGIGLDAMEAVRFTVGYDYGVTNRYQSDNAKANSADIRFGVTFLF
jgi:hypothetical protein